MHPANIRRQRDSCRVDLLLYSHERVRAHTSEQMLGLVRMRARSAVRRLHTNGRVTP